MNESMYRLLSLITLNCLNLRIFALGLLAVLCTYGRLSAIVNGAPGGEQRPSGGGTAH
ncbi:hypothetical protein CPB83DRAFT_194260 [Crepidotus variabilis]|uniref:Uncharacterized protein n=1 Tax=Crepidotus variabilis TaxID=179855 RepID=A0A9P6EJY2_9AGAR|nr:hypothetical protein CPB83DRAFT_194260 [Crepidotus variabilis]